MTRNFDDPVRRLSAGVQAGLIAIGGDYQLIACDPELADTERFCAHYGYPPERSANTILIKAKTGERRFVACVLLATTRLDVNHTVRKRLGARRVSFATADETRAQTGMELGGVTPFGLPQGLEIWIDSRVLEGAYVILGAGTRTAKLKVSAALMSALPSATVVVGLATAD